MKALCEQGKDLEIAITAEENNNLILVWCRGDYEYQVKGKRTIQWLGTDFVENERKITGKELEHLFLDLEKDPMAQACWINKEMSKVVIARKDF